VIVIWGKPLCGFCDAAKAFCESRQLAYEYKELNVDFTRETILETFPGAKSFPQIVVGGTPIGGFDKLAAYCEDTGYNGTGHSLS
jgi:glutaredoxin|tara:strand:+ start:498 stop:752 length:255 start_codon:yes stop_codon:yes gene_type:complete